jgi:hypothetical protein
MHERRQTVRPRTHLGGVMSYNKRRSTMDCVVRNLTQDGAKLVFGGPLPIPDEFDLEVRQRERTFRARAVWRSATEAGVRFVAPEAEPRVIPLDWARRLKDCEADKARLRQRVADLSTAD